MSIILANFGKYAISDCPFIQLFTNDVYIPTRNLLASYKYDVYSPDMSVINLM